MVSWPTQKEIDDYVRLRAPAYGIDVATAVRVRRSESASGFYGDYENGVPQSFGPWQLYKGGLYSLFVRLTGLSPENPMTWREQTDFALKYASQHGWGDWHGAARIGISEWEGIKTPPKNSSDPGDIPEPGINPGWSGDGLETALAYFGENAAGTALFLLGALLIIGGVIGFVTSNPTVRQAAQVAIMKKVPV